MAPQNRLHPGQLAIIWAVVIAIEYGLYAFLQTIDIPLVPVYPSPTDPNARVLREVWASGSGVLYVAVIVLMLVVAAYVLTKTWRWFGASGE